MYERKALTGKSNRKPKSQRGSPRLEATYPRTDEVIPEPLWGRYFIKVR